MIRVVRISQTKRIVNNQGRTPLKTNGRSIFRELTGIQNFILIPIYQSNKLSLLIRDNQGLLGFCDFCSIFACHRLDRPMLYDKN